MRIVISKFLTEMSWSKESFSTMSVCASAASSFEPQEEQRVERVDGSHEEGLAGASRGRSG